MRLINLTIKMNKIKNIIFIAVFSAIIYSCGDNNSGTVDNFDHEAQAFIDNDTLVSFFKNHYFDTTVDSLKPIISGRTSLFDDVNLKTMDVTENEIDYKLYYYLNSVGNPQPAKGFPTVMDSVLVNYYGQRIVDTDSISVTFDNNSATWFRLNDVIRGWSHGFTNFKGGENITGNGPITYQGGGKGILFIPSGLAYRNAGSGSIFPNESILFYIDLYDVIENTDQDNDGVASIMEDPDGDGDPRNDDTDEDLIPNYNDTDDDGDRIQSRDEDVNGDGDPRNDDTDGDLIPNYLDADDDGDGKLTINEDENGDGDPTNDFNDPNNPTLPDYLNPDIG